MEDRGWKMGNSVSILHLQSSIFFDLRVSVALWLNRIPCDELTDGGAVITIPRYEGRSRSRLVDRNARWRARPAGDVQAFSRGDSLHAAASARFRDRKSTRLNSSHQIISYAVFCLKKKKQ